MACGHGLAFHTPVYYLAKGPPRIQPVGGGDAMVRVLSDAARRRGIDIRYACTAKAIRLTEQGAVCGLRVHTADGAEDWPAAAVILATGGFQGSPAMMRAQFGARGGTMRLIAPGTKHNSGDGIRMATACGAMRAGDFGGMHAEPIDPRSANPAPVVLVYPYGIVVDRSGHRFFDEGGGLVHETWEAFAQHIQFDLPEPQAFAILDRRYRDIDGFERAIRSEVAPYQAASVVELARMTGIDPTALAETVAGYNAAATGDPARFDATIADGLAAAPSLHPPKSNWARAIVEPPFFAYPLIGAIAYTFGGIATDAQAQVLGPKGPIPGLFAAGETTGHFYGTAPNAVAILRAAVFGRIAGQRAVSDLQGTKSQSEISLS